GCPPHQRGIADQAALKALQLEYDGKIDPRVSAAFWDAGELVAGADPWETILASGGNLIDIELNEDIDAAMVAWGDYYQWRPQKAALVRTIFERKIANPAEDFELTLQESHALLGDGPPAENVNECSNALRAMGIVLPLGKTPQ